MMFMVIGAVIAIIASVSFLVKIKACKADIIANIILVVLAAGCCVISIADKHYIKTMSEEYDIRGGEFLDKYVYCGMEGDHYTFKKSVFAADEGMYAVAKDKIELPLISRIYKPVRFICVKGSRFSSEKVQPVKNGRLYDEINYNNVVDVTPQPAMAVLVGYIAALAMLTVYDLSRLFLMGIRNGIEAYDESRGKDKIIF